MKMNKLLIVLFFVLLFVGCQPQYESYKQIDPSGWNKDSLAIFNFEVSDTLHPFDMYINVRNQGAYSYSNLWLFIDITAPDSTTLRDTIEITLAKTDGTWIGKGTSGLFELQLPYRQNIIFPYSGKYTLSIEQAMRSEKLEGIQNIGIKIDKTR